MKKQTMSYFLIAIGLILLGAGLFLLKTLENPQGFMVSLPYVFLGIGCGIFGHGLGDVLYNKAGSKDTKCVKQINIDVNDERNVAVANRAKSKAYDIMVLVFGILMLLYTLMNIDLIAILLLVGAYLIVIACRLYYRSKYDKEM